MSDRLICSMGIDEALSLLVRNKVDLGYEANEALDTLCLWVEWKLKQERDEWERDEWEREEEYTRNKEEQQL